LEITTKGRYVAGQKHTLIDISTAKICKKSERWRKLGYIFLEKVVLSGLFFVYLRKIFTRERKGES
jgi:hypothetical protein